MVVVMFNLILDIFIYNYTPYKSFFFLLNINDKSIIYNIIISLIIDLFITHTYILTTVFIIVVWFLKNKYVKIHNLVQYYVFNILMILGYFALFNGFLLKNIFNILFINSIYIYISYKKNYPYIKCMGDINWMNI